MSNTRDTGFLRNAIQVTDQGVTFVSGSTTLMSISSSGAVTTTGVISGSNALSASFSLNSALLNGTGSVGFATTASLLAVSSSQQQISSSQQQISASLLNVVANYATTGSNSFRANQSITGSLVVSSTITAQTLVVQTVTSSIVYSSGSNLFGSALGDRQTFTGSVNITGSQTVFGNAGINGGDFRYRPNGDVTNSPALVFKDAGNSALDICAEVIGDANAASRPITFRVSSVDNGRYEAMRITSAGYVGIGTTNPAYLLDVNGTGRFTGILTAQTGILFPTTQTVSSTGSIGFNSTQGLFIYAKTGASYDFKVYNGVGSTFMQVPTGTQNVEFLSRVQANGVFRQFATTGYYSDFAYSGTTYNLGSSETTDNIDFKIAGGGTFSTGGNFRFFTQTGNTTPVERMRITSGGNVGIGVTSIVNAIAKLEVKGDLFVTPSGSAASKLHLYNADSSNESYIYDTGGTSSSVITLAPGGNTSLSVASTAVTIAPGRKLVITGDNYYQSSAQDLAFGSGIREIFRVSHVGLCTGGRFSIAGTGNSFVHSSQWAWNSTHNGGYGRAWLIQLTSGEYSNITMYVDTTPGGDVIISTNLGGAFTMNVFIEKTSGGVIDLTYQNADRTSAASGYTRVQSTTSISYGSQFYSVVAATLGGSGNRALYSDAGGLITNSSSDITLKKNVENIAYGLNSIMALRPIAFNWIPENLGPQKEIGFIAQEVQQSIPELIGTNKDETLSLDYPKLTAVLTKAIQELKLENDSLKEILQRNNIN